MTIEQMKQRLALLRARLAASEAEQRGPSALDDALRRYDPDYGHPVGERRFIDEAERAVDLAGRER